MPTAVTRRIAATALAVLLSMTLAACFVLPGKFVSTLDLRRDGHFAYTYKGEIFLLGLSKLANMGNVPPAPFEPSPCYDHDAEMTQRECTKAEIDQQRGEWEETTKASEAKRKQESEQLRAILGGIDPNDPKASEELAARLRRQAGWKSVAYKGDGLFDVDFAIAGTLDHDFTFPTMERMPIFLPFVTVNRHSDGSVRMEAPAFTTSGGGGLGPMSAMSAKGSGEREMPDLPQLDGQFTLTTDGRILANNTDEGPRADPAGQRLEWKVTPRTGSAPTALINLGS